MDKHYVRILKNQILSLVENWELNIRDYEYPSELHGHISILSRQKGFGRWLETHAYADCASESVRQIFHDWHQMACRDDRDSSREVAA